MHCCGYVVGIKCRQVQPDAFELLQEKICRQ
jgi:hypothetical protein